jgi:type I restriction enzyme, S subunit
MVSSSLTSASGGPRPGGVPPGWTVKQLKWAVTFQRGHDLPTEDRITGSVPVFSGGGITGWHDVPQARAPGIVTGRYGTIGEFHLVERDYWPLNTSLYSIDLHGNSAAFLRYMLESLAPLFHLNAAKSAVPGIDRSDIHTIPVAVPPLPIQQGIAGYLDRETTRVDALVEAKKRVLGLLAEKRRALIARAVIRGLDQGVPLRDSGIPWLGDIPAHWETRRAAWLFRERDERGEGELPLLEVSINAGVTLREFSDERIESTAADHNSYKVARRGDVVFNKMRMWQGAVGIAPEDGLVSPDYVVAKPTYALRPEYAGLLFRTEMFSAECARRSHGIVWDRLRLYWDGFRDIELPLPPAETQEEIVVRIALETAKLDAVRQATERSVALLKERRAALIAAAVTGLINVGNAA